MTEPKRFLILTADVGFGHRNAANAVAEALIKTHGEECQVVIFNPLDDERTPGFLRDSQTDYDRMVREIPELYKLRYEISDSPVPNAIFESAMTVLLFTVIRDSITNHKPDVILITHPMFPAPVNAVKVINRLGIPVLTVVTDLADVHRLWFNDTVDLLLVPTIEAREQAIKLGMPEEILRVTGIPVRPGLVEETRSPQVIRRELGWQPDLATVLVVGSKRVKNLRQVLRALNHSRLPMQLAIVAGGDESLYHHLQDTEWHVQSYLYNFVNDMVPLLKAADCIVSKAGGLIVTEALACGLPLLMVDVTPGQEMGNAGYVVKNGAGALAADPIEALEVLFHWTEEDAASLNTYKSHALGLGRPYSAQEVAELAWKAARQTPQPVVTGKRSPVLPRLLELLGNFGIPASEEDQRPAPGKQSHRIFRKPGL